MSTNKHFHGRAFKIMNLETDQYVGLSTQSSENRTAREVLCLSEDKAHSEVTLIQKKDHPHFLIKVEDHSTGVVNGLVKAILDTHAGDFHSESWVVTAQPGHGDDVYTIETSDKSAGWIVDTENLSPAGSQIKVAPLNPSESEGILIYDATALFVFTPIESK